MNESSLSRQMMRREEQACFYHNALQARLLGQRDIIPRKQFNCHWFNACIFIGSIAQKALTHSGARPRRGQTDGERHGPCVNHGHDWT